MNDLESTLKGCAIWGIAALMAFLLVIFLMVIGAGLA